METTAKKSNTKLNALLAIEKEMQEKWENEKMFEEDAPADLKQYALKKIWLRVLAIRGLNC